MKKIVIGISTWSLQQLSFTQGASIEDIIAMVADMGVEGIDICEEYIPCHPHPDLVKIRNLRQLVERKKLRIGATWYCTEILKAIKASDEAHVLDVYRKNILIACEMGAGYVCIPMLLDDDLTYEERLWTYLRYFEKLLPFAEKNNMPIAHECPRQNTPQMSLEIAKYFHSKYYRVCPDLEVWRVNTLDLPLSAHGENPNAIPPSPESIDLFRECLPYAPYVHFKLLALDENGEEPHFPIPEIMQAINESPINHYLCIEYEGWIPDIRPEKDSLTETRRCVELIRRYQF
jgi:hypothetical protein